MCCVLCVVSAKFLSVNFSSSEGRENSKTINADNFDIDSKYTVTKIDAIGIIIGIKFT